MSTYLLCHVILKHQSDLKSAATVMLCNDSPYHFTKMLSNDNITAGTYKDPLQRSAFGHARQHRATVTLYITCDDVGKDTEPIYH